MKVIPTRVHGCIDYISGLLLLFSPQVFGFAEYGGAAVAVPRFIGILILAQSIFTRYELGLIKVLPMRAHLAMDYVASVLLAASPWLFGFADLPSNAWMPHVIVGVGYFVITLLTQREPAYLHRRAASHNPA